MPYLVSTPMCHSGISVLRNVRNPELKNTKTVVYALGEMS